MSSDSDSGAYNTSADSSADSYSYNSSLPLEDDGIDEDFNMTYYSGSTYDYGSREHHAGDDSGSGQPLNGTQDEDHYSGDSDSNHDNSSSDYDSAYDHSSRAQSTAIVGSEAR